VTTAVVGVVAQETLENRLLELTRLVMVVLVLGGSMVFSTLEEAAAVGGTLALAGLVVMVAAALALRTTAILALHQVQQIRAAAVAAVQAALRQAQAVALAS
jgi:hypothetical protein